MFTKANDITSIRSNSLPPETDFMHHAISAQLAIEILDGIWAESTSITLEDIQNRFSVSRTVAREACKDLEAGGAVEAKRRVGLIALPPKQWAALNPQVITWKLHSTQRLEQIRCLTELRLAVEPVAAADTASRGSIETRAAMPILAKEMRRHAEVGDLNSFHQLDIRFHTMLMVESGNELFASLADIVATVLRGRVELSLYPAQAQPEALDAHDAVAEAIWMGKPEKARSAMRDIVDEVAHALES